MPKMKTNRGAAKRFRTTGSGKIMRRSAFLNHKLESKAPARKRRLAGDRAVAPADVREVRRLLGK